MENLEGKAALITGGGSGIGRGMARAFAASGIRLLLADADPETVAEAASELRDGGAEALSIAFDIRDRAAWGEAVEMAERAYGGVDILCNNAGVTDMRSVLDIPVEYFDWIVGVNLAGVFNGIRAAAPGMVARGRGGHIVNTASMAGVLPPEDVLHATYSATKYAVVGLTEAVREELAPHGIGVSVLVPGLVNTRIGETIRKLRPKLDVPPPRPAALSQSLKFLGDAMPARGKDPLEVGRLTLAGIRADELYIVTNGEYLPKLKERHAAIEAAFAAAGARQ